MKPTKVGQVAKFHTPFKDEDPNQLYVVVEVKGNDDSARADIKALNDNTPLPGISTVLLADLEVVKLSTAEPVGHNVTIVKSYKSGKVTGAKGNR